MRRFRTHWLALPGAMMLLSLSVSSAFGHHPAHPDNRGNAVSTFVHELLFGTDEEPEEEGEGDEEEGEGDEEEGEGDEEDSNHGHCVREVAWSLETGGLNENHGGAVSEAAKVTCRGGGDEEEPTEGSEDEEGDGEGDDEESLTANDRGDRGRSAAAHQQAPGKNKVGGRAAGHGKANAHGGGHGKGHGRH